MIQFLNKVHRLRFGELMARAHIIFTDTHTTALFYVIAGSEYLYERVTAIYNFYLNVADERVLYSDMQIIPMNSTNWWLLEYAFCLYFETYPVDAQLLFAHVNDSDMFLIVEAAKIRYKLNDAHYA